SGHVLHEVVAAFWILGTGRDHGGPTTGPGDARIALGRNRGEGVGVLGVWCVFLEASKLPVTGDHGAQATLNERAGSRGRARYGGWLSEVIEFLEAGGFAVILCPLVAGQIELGIRGYFAVFVIEEVATEGKAVGVVPALAEVRNESGLGEGTVLVLHIEGVKHFGNGIPGHRA